jgi:hypothetical protein
MEANVFWLADDPCVRRRSPFQNFIERSQIDVQQALFKLALGGGEQRVAGVAGPVCDDAPVGGLAAGVSCLVRVTAKVCCPKDNSHSKTHAVMKTHRAKNQASWV